ncbi:hypothetical protein ELD05_11720 [Caldicellulosiruptor changbaiensis]|uniref:Uncharacterized protein n=1 Tax=Caldicellulosiruptor changbaiensis TaxID=1222016 RepID=A0A3T0D8G1_9FIRM|nr:hypothetical protein [Caldicellulosiruptor changbaiensis]AZT91239.1 hypothetical protein ELD05_11720 [Caldicellulosiruptor changbaiensis]
MREKGYYTGTIVFCREIFNYESSLEKFLSEIKGICEAEVLEKLLIGGIKKYYPNRRIYSIKYKRSFPAGKPAYICN